MKVMKGSSQMRILMSICAIFVVCAIGCSDPSNPKHTLPTYQNLPAEAVGTWYSGNSLVFSINPDSSGVYSMLVCDAIQMDDSGNIFYTVSGSTAEATGYTWNASLLAICYYGTALTKTPSIPAVTYQDLPAAALGDWYIGTTLIFTITTGSAGTFQNIICDSIQMDSSGNLFYTVSGYTSQATGYTWNSTQNAILYNGTALTRTAVTPTLNLVSLPASASGRWSRPAYNSFPILVDVFVITTSSTGVYSPSSVASYYGVAFKYNTSNGDLYYNNGADNRCTGYTWDDTNQVIKYNGTLTLTKGS